jgi:DNA-binding transcriptional MerR regulator
MMYQSKYAQDNRPTTLDIIEALPSYTQGEEQIHLIEYYLEVRKNNPNYYDKQYNSMKRENYTKNEIIQITELLNKEAKNLIIKAFATSNYSIYHDKKSIDQFNRIKKQILLSYHLDDIQELVELESKKNPKFMDLIFRSFVHEAENIEKLLFVLKEQNEKQRPTETKELSLQILHKMIAESPTKKSLQTGIETFEKVFGISFLECKNVLYIRKPYPNDMLELILEKGADKLLSENDGIKLLEKYIDGNNINQSKTIIRYLAIQDEAVQQRLASALERLKSGKMPEGRGYLNYPQKLINERIQLGYELEKIYLEVSMEKEENSDKINTKPIKKMKI